MRSHFRPPNGFFHVDAAGRGVTLTGNSARPKSTAVSPAQVGTLALSAGVSPRIASEQLGHASVAFTLEVYSHVLPHMQDSAAMKVEALLMAP